MFAFDLHVGNSAPTQSNPGDKGDGDDGQEGCHREIAWGKLSEMQIFKHKEKDKEGAETPGQRPKLALLPLGCLSRKSTMQTRQLLKGGGGGIGPGASDYQPRLIKPSPSERGLRSTAFPLQEPGRGQRRPPLVPCWVRAHLGVALRAHGLGLKAEGDPEGATGLT